MSETRIPKSIATGLVKAQAYARGVAKEGRNRSGNYDYATSEDIIAESRKSLIEGGKIAFVALGWSFEAQESGPVKTKTGQDGKTKTLAASVGRITLRYLLVSLEDGESYEATSSAPVVPDFGRPDDKAEFGAVTACHAYTLRGLLNLPRGVEGVVDIHARDDSDWRPASAPAAREPGDDSDPPSDGARPRNDNVGVRSAADAAVAAQVRGPVGAVGFDPAYEAMCDDLIRRARASGVGPGLEEPAIVWDAIADAKLPGPLTARALEACSLRAIEIAADLEVLESWFDPIAKAKLPTLIADRVFESCFLRAFELARDMEVLERTWAPRVKPSIGSEAARARLGDAFDRAEERITGRRAA